MALEIERKFLVVSEPWRDAPTEYFCQGYLNRDPLRTVRVRVAEGQGWLTVKGETTGAAREEFEYEIPVADAQVLLKLCEQPLVEKNRRLVEFAGLTWEVDEFLGENAGLVVAEVELESPAQTVELPPWVGQEVTDDPRYYNSNLSTRPFSAWRDEQAE